MPTKREEIREAIKEHIELCLRVSGGIPSETFPNSVSHSLVALLDDLGVVPEE